jgi:hypothetical protein
VVHLPNRQRWSVALDRRCRAADTLRYVGVSYHPPDGSAVGVMCVTASVAGPHGLEQDNREGGPNPLLSATYVDGITDEPFVLEWRAMADDS